MLVGEKVVLRGLELRDAKELHKYVNDWEVRQYLNMFYPISEVEEEEFVKSSWEKRKSGTDFIFAIDDRESGQLIGTIGLHRIDWKNRNAELGIAIWKKDYWGKGYGADAIKTLLKYAFHELNLHKIYLRVYDFNKRAMRCYEKVGFKKEGILREAFWRNGKWHDTIFMGILQSEFEQE